MDFLQQEFPVRVLSAFPSPLGLGLYQFESQVQRECLLDASPIQFGQWLINMQKHDEARNLRAYAYTRESIHGIHGYRERGCCNHGVRWRGLTLPNLAGDQPRVLKLARRLMRPRRHSTTGIYDFNGVQGAGRDHGEQVGCVRPRLPRL